MFARKREAQFKLVLLTAAITPEHEQVAETVLLSLNTLPSYTSRTYTPHQTLHSMFCLKKSAKRSTYHVYGDGEKDVQRRLLKIYI